MMMRANLPSDPPKYDTEWNDHQTDLDTVFDGFVDT